MFFLLGDPSASEFYVTTFRNTLCSIFISDKDGGVLTPPLKMEKSVPKRLHVDSDVGETPERKLQHSEHSKSLESKRFIFFCVFLLSA